MFNNAAFLPFDSNHQGTSTSLIRNLVDQLNTDYYRYTIEDFVEEYFSEDLAGKEAMFKVKLHEVKAIQIPEINEDFFADLGMDDVHNLEELQAHVKEHIQSHKEMDVENKYIDDLLEEIRIRVEKDQRVLVTTLTKKMAEDLTDYLHGVGVRVRYLHSEVKTIERMEILRDLRQGEFDVLVGINLLREGLDLPEVSLVAILDADKEGFLRSETSLIQTIGRAARNAEGKVIMYGDVITGSMRRAIDETERRRELQMRYNREHGITPKTVQKNIRAVIEATMVAEEAETYTAKPKLSAKEREKQIRILEKEMKAAAKALEFEKAAALRDEIRRLQEEE